MRDCYVIVSLNNDFSIWRRCMEALRQRRGNACSDPQKKGPLRCGPRDCGWLINDAYFTVSSVFSAPFFTVCPTFFAPFLTPWPVALAAS